MNSTHKLTSGKIYYSEVIKRAFRMYVCVINGNKDIGWVLVVVVYAIIAL